MQQVIMDGRICAPETLAVQVVCQKNQSSGHPGVKRIVLELNWRYIWPSTVNIPEVSQQVRRHCVVYQACEHHNQSMRHPIVATTVPAHVMSSGALDVFFLPIVQ